LTQHAPTPVRPNDRFGVLSWNIKGNAGAKTALVTAMTDQPNAPCPWAVVLVQEWTPPGVKVTVGRVVADLADCPPAGWTVACATTTTGRHQRRSVIFVRLLHPSVASWPLELVGQGEHETLCWVKLKVEPRLRSQPARDVLIANLHSTSRGSAQDALTRAKLARRTRRELQRVRGADKEALFIAGGDWNAEPWDDEMTGLELHAGVRSYPELAKVLHQARDPRLYNPTWSLVQSRRTNWPGGTYFYSGERGRADRWKWYDQFLLNDHAAARYLKDGDLQLRPDLSKHERFTPNGAPYVHREKQKIVDIPHLSDHVPLELTLLDPCKFPEVP
jgi:hypothetical protein